MKLPATSHQSPELKLKITFSKITCWLLARYRLVTWLAAGWWLLTGFTAPVFAQEWQTFDPNPLPNSGPGAATFKSLEAVFANILSVAFALAGFAAFVMLILGGFRYLTSSGDPKATAQARGTLTWAIAGLLFLIGAWFILSLISEFTGIEGLLQFTVPGN